MACSGGNNQNLKIKKGLWSPEEDEKLFTYITRFGVGCWSSIPQLAGLKRCGKSCRLRWVNYLRPDLKRGGFSQQEEDIIISLHQVLGNRWAQIATKLPGRTDNEIKNFWNSCLKKKLIKQGVDPNTHKPITDIPKEVNGNNISFASKKSKNFQSSSSPSSSSSSMALMSTHELGQAFHLNNNGGLTNNLFLGELEMGIDPIDLNCNLLDQYQQMNCETSSSSFDLYDNLTSRMIMDSFMKEEARESSSTNYCNSNMNNDRFEGCKIKTKSEEGNANQWHELPEIRANNAGDFAFGRVGQLVKEQSDFVQNNAEDFNIYQMGFLSETLLGDEYLDVFH